MPRQHGRWCALDLEAARACHARCGLALAHMLALAHACMQVYPTGKRDGAGSHLSSESVCSRVACHAVPAHHRRLLRCRQAGRMLAAPVRAPGSRAAPATAACCSPHLPCALPTPSLPLHFRSLPVHRPHPHEGGPPPRAVCHCLLPRNRARPGASGAGGRPGAASDAASACMLPHRCCWERGCPLRVCAPACRPRWVSLCTTEQGHACTGALRCASISISALIKPQACGSRG